MKLRLHSTCFVIYTQDRISDYDDSMFCNKIIDITDFLFPFSIILEAIFLQETFFLQIMATK